MFAAAENPPKKNAASRNRRQFLKKSLAAAKRIRLTFGQASRSSFYTQFAPATLTLLNCPDIMNYPTDVWTKLLYSCTKLKLQQQAHNGVF